MSQKIKTIKLLLDYFGDLSEECDRLLQYPNGIDDLESFTKVLATWLDNQSNASAEALKNVVLSFLAYTEEYQQERSK